MSEVSAADGSRIEGEARWRNLQKIYHNLGRKVRRKIPTKSRRDHVVKLTVLGLTNVSHTWKGISQITDVWMARFM